MAEHGLGDVFTEVSLLPQQAASCKDDEEDQTDEHEDGPGDVGSCVAARGTGDKGEEHRSCGAHELDDGPKYSAQMLTGQLSALPVTTPMIARLTKTVTGVPMRLARIPAMPRTKVMMTPTREPKRSPIAPQTKLPTQANPAETSIAVMASSIE